MKKLILVLSALMISLAAISQGIEFQKERYAEVLKMAKKQHKLVFVDIYTSWCGPCKHMAKNIFPETKAGAYYNAHFLNLQLDAEKSEDGKMVAKQFDVSAYPTFLFVNGDGELVYRFLGGRTVDMFVQEGEKAIEAYAAQPELKKYMKKYEKGNRDKQFLNQYFILKDKSGLDCSDVLTDYFALVADDELLDSLHVQRIAKITAFDHRLMNRLVDAVCKKTGAPDKDKKSLVAATKAVATYLGACLKESAQKNNEENFDEVLALKERLFAATGSHDSATTASLGGGNIYVPSDLSRLNYYSAKKKTDKFNRTFLNYMTVIQKKYKETAQEKIKLQEELDKKLQAAKESGNEDEYKSIKRMSGMMFAFSGIDDYYTSTSMIENVERYEGFYNGTKDAAFTDRLAGWYVFLHQMSPSAKTAVYVADKLLTLDRKQQAIEVLTLGLEKGEKGLGVEAEDVAACKNKLEELK